MERTVMNKKKLVVALALVMDVVIFSFAPSAYAVPMLKLTSGLDTVTITDELSGDLSGIPGSVLFIGSVGSFTLNITGGTTKPVIGSPDDPILDLGSIINLNLGGAGTLTLAFTETGFTGPTPLANFLSSIGGTSSNPNTTVQLQTYLDITNAAFGVGTPIGNTGSILTGSDLAFSAASSSGDVATSSPYSLTMVVTLQQPNYTVSSFDAQLRAVPEPLPLYLLGVGLVGIGLLSRRKKAEAAK